DLLGVVHRICVLCSDGVAPLGALEHPFDLVLLGSGIDPLRGLPRLPALPGLLASRHLAGAELHGRGPLRGRQVVVRHDRVVLKPPAAHPDAEREGVELVERVGREVAALAPAPEVTPGVPADNREPGTQFVDVDGHPTPSAVSSTATSSPRTWSRTAEASSTPIVAENRERPSIARMYRSASRRSRTVPEPSPRTSNLAIPFAIPAISGAEGRRFESFVARRENKAFSIGVGSSLGRSWDGWRVAAAA